MERFLRYSLEHERSIRAVFLLEGVIVQKSISILALDADAATLRIGTRKTPLVLPLADILSCDYARGDRGEG